jgi:CheY-like chemotaxis protein
MPDLPALNSALDRRTTTRRQHDRLLRPGRRRTDRRQLSDTRRVLLVGPDKGWRLLTAYVFEEAGYAVYCATGQRRAVQLTANLLPDAVVVQDDRPSTRDALAELSETSITCDIPVVVLVPPPLRGVEERPARAAGSVTLLTEPRDVNALVGEVDTLIATGARAQRTLRRRLLKLQQVAAYHSPDLERRSHLLDLIHHLQVPIVALQEEGRCVAVSQGAMSLTGYSRRRWLGALVFDPDFPLGPVSSKCWQDFLADRYYVGSMRMKRQTGDDAVVHVAAVATIMAGVHAAAFASS